ncbi:Alkbh6 protein [Peziza echinospora]|nr:Alkbh6 protein [Peziza echinospora]
MFTRHRDSFGSNDRPTSPLSECSIADSENDFPSWTFRRSSASSATPTLPKDLSTAKIVQLPNSAYYIPNFISETEELLLLDKISRAPKPHWTQLSHRRLITYPSALTPNNLLLNSPLPLWLAAPFIPRMQALNIWKHSPHGQPNHVLINEYKPGEGIFPHEDGDAYHPMVATISLGGTMVLDVFEKDAIRNPEEERSPAFRILQEPRSLLITTDDLYTSHLHGIATIEVDERLGADTIANWELLGDMEDYSSGRNIRTTRTSLTYRDVLRVSNLAGRILGRR